MISPMIIVEALFFIAALLFCLHTLNKTPRDVGAVVTALRDRNTSEIPATASIVLVYWSVAALLLWYIVIPDMKYFVSTWIRVARLFSGTQGPE